MRPKILLLGSTVNGVATVLAPLAEVSVATDLAQAEHWAERGQVYDMIVCGAKTAMECLRLRRLTRAFPLTHPKHVLCVWFGEPSLAQALARRTGYLVLAPAEASRRLLEQVRAVGVETGPSA